MSSKIKHNVNAIRDAVTIVGGGGEMGRELGVTRQLVNLWTRGRNNLDIKHVLKIEKLTGGKVTRHNLRPDVYPEIDDEDEDVVEA